MGHVLHNYDWDWQGAEREFKRAIELNPNYAIVHHWYAHLLMQQGRAQEGLAEARRAQELDPLSLSVNNGLARQYYLSHLYDQSIAQCKKGLEIDSGVIDQGVPIVGFNQAWQCLRRGSRAQKSLSPSLQLTAVATCG